MSKKEKKYSTQEKLDYQWNWLVDRANWAIDLMKDPIEREEIREIFKNYLISP